jgi:hypothetical protein
MLLGWQQSLNRRFIAIVLAFGVLSGLIGFYMGYQVTPIEYIRYSNNLFEFSITLMIAAVIALVFIEPWSEQRAFDFPLMFMHSWRHVLTLCFSLLFVLLSWAILMLWGALFEAIEIDFFMDLFTERWFIYPISGLLNGLGIVMFRRLSNIIDTVVNLLHIIMVFLLVAVSFVSVIFLTALPFSGLQPLWDSGGSFLILWMQVLLLFFANGVFQQGRERAQPYPLWVHRFILVSLLLLPIYSAISFYGLTLRVSQYGWTVERSWAVLIWFVITLFSVIYSYLVVRYREQWFDKIGRANIGLAFGLLLILLAVNSPLLDFRKIAVASQLARIENGTVPVTDLDIDYFRYHLARPGYLALQDLKEVYGSTHPAFVVRIDNLYKAYDAELTYEEFDALLNKIDSPEPAVLNVMHTLVHSNFNYVGSSEQLYTISEDLNGDGELEHILFIVSPYQVRYALVYSDGEQWQHNNLRYLPSSSNYEQIDLFKEALENKMWQSKIPLWRDLNIGEFTFSFEDD